MAPSRGDGYPTRVTFSVGLNLTAKCAGCDADVPDWEARTKGTGEPAAALKGPDGGGFLVETRETCECGATRVRVSFRIG